LSINSTVGSDPTLVTQRREKQTGTNRCDMLGHQEKKQHNKDYRVKSHQFLKVKSGVHTTGTLETFKDVGKH